MDAKTPPIRGGLCSKHYNRLRTTGTTDNGPKARLSFEERLWKNIDKRGPDDCWNWTASVGGHGYGLIGLGGRSAGKEAVHRVVWRFVNGEIPRSERSGHHGTVIRHKCNNRRCCNPVHLELGTQQDNVADMWEPGDHLRGNARLSEKEVSAIRSDPRSSRKLAPIYGVTDGHIRSIRSGRAWTKT